MGLLTRLGCVQGLYPFDLVSGGLLILISFSGSFNLASGSFLASPPLSLHPLPSLATVPICPLEPREGHGGWSLFPIYKKWGTERLPCPGGPRGLSFNSKFIWKDERLRIANTMLKNKVRGLTLPEFKTYYKATVIKTVWNWWRNRQVYQCKRIESPEMGQHKYSQLIFCQRSKDNPMEKGWSFQPMVTE